MSCEYLREDALFFRILRGLSSATVQQDEGVTDCTVVNVCVWLIDESVIRYPAFKV